MSSNPESRSNGHRKPVEGPQSPETALPSDSITPFLSHRSAPDVDPERVARARKLLEDGGYPSEKVLESVARHLARNWPDSPSADLPGPRR
ncbi:MAG TPA: hypothetical protein DCM86_05215 [Verrucomicrobiales bacterium]|nr:hypothetical protein [Verrucomicrobiales bacterium]